MDNWDIIDTEDLVLTNTEYENLKCPICHNIFNQPKACGNCLNHFCKNCIQVWRITRPDQCPLCKHFSTSKTVPILINLLSKLTFRCPQRKSGCNLIVSYQEYIKHSKQCPEKMIECPSEGCFQSFKQKELAEHQQNCLYTYVSCVWCHRAYVRNQMKSHIPDCPERLQKCSYCIDLFKMLQLQGHCAKCPKKPVQCKWCKKQVILEVIQQHQNTCDMKEVSCLGCKIKMKLIEFYPHQNVCGDYPVVCSRCNESIKRKEFKDHGIDKCVECLSRKYQEEISSLRIENANLKQRVSRLEIKQEYKNRKGTLSFSQILRDPDIFVNRNFAMVRHHKKKNRDRFLLLDSEALNKDRMTWRIKVKSFRSEWFAVGISDETNIYTLHRYQTLGHCSYLVSANGTIYSTHNLLWNHQRTDFVIQPHDEIECVFDPTVRIALTITNLTKNKFVVIQVSPFQLESKRYYPCICFRYPGDAVEIVPNE